MYGKNREQAMEHFKRLKNYFEDHLNGKQLPLDYLIIDADSHIHYLEWIMGEMNKSRKGAYWYKDEDEFLLGLFNDGASFINIANTLKRTETAILGRLEHLGVIGDDWREYKENQIFCKLDMQHFYQLQEQKEITNEL